MTDWQPGDVAICINNTAYDGGVMDIKIGREYVVIEVFVGDGAFEAGDSYDDEGLCLRLLGVVNSYNPDHDGFDERRFEKKPPLVKETETEREKELTK